MRGKVLFSSPHFPAARAAKIFHELAQVGLLAGYRTINTLLDLNNSSNHTKAEYNSCDQCTVITDAYAEFAALTQGTKLFTTRLFHPHPPLLLHLPLPLRSIQTCYQECRIF